MRIACVLLLVGTAALAREVTIHRDRWGVPHIFAESLADGAYGLGYVQAEDRLGDLYANYRRAAGRLAEVEGPGAVEGDWAERLAGHEVVCRRRYPELPAEVRAACESFQDGVRAYLAAHPQAVSAKAIDLEPWMIPALARQIIFFWPMGQARRELGLPAGAPLFSNAWAVRPERTADGAALLLIDPHVPWSGAMRFYEFRMHAGGIDQSGFGAVGAPMIGLGHTAYVGWAATTGGPDTTDIYVEQLDPDNPRRYRYDDGWRELTRETVTIAVKGAAPVVRELLRSHHGPIARQEAGKAYAIACPYFDEVDLVTQHYRMLQARNLTEFGAALSMCQLHEQNIVAADVEGNIGYQRTGRVPVRPPGFDFSRPVPGHTSRSEWLGLHPARDLVQVLNPPSGYLQNCNISPDTMTKAPLFDPAAYPAYIYGDSRGRSNSRGRRAVELLEAHPKLTVEAAMAIAMDTHADRCEPWLAEVREAAKAVDLDRSRDGVQPGDLRQAVARLLAWDGRMDAESAAATYYRGLRMEAEKLSLPVGEKPLSRSQQEALVDALARVVAWLVANHGRAEIPYGQVHRVRRGDRSWPLSGGESGGGQTLRAITAELDGKVYYGRGGQSWTQVVQLRPGAVRSWSVTPLGQSDDPASPHYTDQAEKLFSTGRLKPTWFDPAELAGQTESTVVLRR